MFSVLRVYPRHFGQKLLEVYKATDMDSSRRDLRRHFAVEPLLTDRENFELYPLGDLWGDAQLLQVVKYVYNYKGLKIPDSWVNTMEKFMADVDATASYLKKFQQHVLFLCSWSLVMELPPTT